MLTDPLKLWSKNLHLGSVQLYMVISLLLSHSFTAHVFFPTQLSPIPQLPGLRVPLRQDLTGRGRAVAGSWEGSSGKVSLGLLLVQSHTVLLSPGPGQWPKWKCRSESSREACEWYRWKLANTILGHCPRSCADVGPGVDVYIR